MVRLRETVMSLRQESDYIRDKRYTTLILRNLSYKRLLVSRLSI